MKEISLTEQYFSKLKIENLSMDNENTCEIFIPEKHRDRIPFKNEFCEFKPVGWVRTDFGWVPLAYKVVTKNLESLGLRSNPTPMKFSVGNWVFEERELQYGSKDWGGIWTALRKGSIKTLKSHCLDTWGMETRGFLTAIYNPVAVAGNYRIKSEGVMLLKEIF